MSGKCETMYRNTDSKGCGCSTTMGRGSFFNKRAWFGVLVLFAVLTGCASTGESVTQVDFFTGGTGLAGEALMVLAPRGMGIADSESWMPLFVQGTLNSRLKKFSPFTVLERQYVDSILEELKKSESDFYSDTDYTEIGRWSRARYILNGSLTRDGTGEYTVDLRITEVETLRAVASFRKSGSPVDLAAGRLLNEAVETLLKGAGITLTDAGRDALYKSSASGDMAFARGIIARRSGAVFDALAAYYEAGFYNPSLKEEIDSLASLLTETVSAANLGASIRADIELQNKWSQLLAECSAYYDKNPPFEIVYDSAPVQSSGINFQAGTIVLTTKVALVPTAAFKAAESVENGLYATGKMSTWEFQNFFNTIPGLKPRLNAEVTLVNGEDLIINKQTCSFDANHYNSIYPTTGVAKVTFQNIPVDAVKGEMRAFISNVWGGRDSPLTQDYFAKIKISSLVDYLNGLEMPVLDMVAVPQQKKFLLSREPVTYRQWFLIRAWARNRGYIFEQGRGYGSPDIDDFPVINGMDLPVTDITEEDIYAFCNAYNEYLGNPPACFYVRPSNDERGLIETFMSFFKNEIFKDVKTKKESLYRKVKKGSLVPSGFDERKKAETVLRPSVYLESEYVEGSYGSSFVNLYEYRREEQENQRDFPLQGRMMGFRLMMRVN